MNQPDWCDQLGDAQIRRTVGVESFRRGVAYAREGAVGELTVNRDHRVLFASVQGTRRTPYRVIVSGDEALVGHSLNWSGRCTCPMDVDCKHVAAVMLAARASFEPVARAGGQASWQRSVAALVGPFRTTPVAAGVALALQLERTTPPPARRRYPPHRAPDPVSGPGGRLRIRPVVRGKSGRWVRTGVSWRDLQYDYGRSGHVQAHRDALKALFAAHLAHTNAYYAYDSAVYLDQFGPSLWSLLGEAVRAGVDLVPAKAAPGAITLRGPATVSLDLTRSAPSGDAALRPVITIGDDRFGLTSATLLGDPVHGLALEDDGGLVLAPLDEPANEHVARLLHDPAPIQIPTADLDTFLHGYYPALRQAVPVACSDATVELPQAVPPHLALTVSYLPAHRVDLSWAFAYGAGDEVRRVPLDRPDRPDVGVEAGVAPALRDLRAEQQLLDSFELPDHHPPQLVSLAAARPRLVPDVTLTGMDAVRFTQDLLPALLDDPEIDVLVLGDVPDYRAAETPPMIRLSATESTDDHDWFDLGVTVSIDGEQIPFNDLFVALAGGASHLILDTGTYFPLDRPELDQLRRLIEEARALQDRGSDQLRVSVYQAGLWEELQQLGVIETQSRRWASAVQGLLSLEQIAPPAVPDSLDADLRPYQVDGYQWLSFLHQHGLGGILADDMGLGKTMQTLAMICRVHESGELPGPFLVVAPTSVVPGWAHEAQRFAPRLKVVAATETARRRGTPLAEDIDGADLVITSYALFRIDYEDYAATPWAGLILDEAQFVKNHQAKTYQCARRLPAPFKLAITGTPLENSLMDLWSLLSIVAPGLFPHPQHFSEVYRKPIEGGGAPELLATLRRRIAPLMRRRTKEQVVLDLPPKQEQVLEVQLNARHAKIYQTHLQRERQKVLGLIDDLDKNRFAIFRSLTLLRQMSLDASLIDDSYAGVPSSKAEVLLEHLDAAISGGHRVLVFSQFTSFLRIVRDRLDGEGVSYTYLDGRTRNRAKRIAQFKDGDSSVFLISLKAGGVGLNLTEADYVFVLDPWWNPAVEAQAVDRTHRIGQDKNVMVYRLVATDTIEEKVMALKARKQSLFARVMDDDALLSAPLTADDIKGLFG